MRFSVQEYRSGFPFPTPGNLPDPGIEPAPFAREGKVLTTGPPGKSQKLFNFYTYFSYNFPVMKMTAKLENISRILKLET